MTRAGLEVRGISRQIEKNRGLTPHRKKDSRNARLKNRHKYEKALKRRRGQVRTVIEQSAPYAGEGTGINPAVVRAVRFPPR